VRPGFRCRPFLLLCLLPLEAQTEVPNENPYASAADVERGKHLFANNCAVCHGPAGAGGRGANLARPKLPRSPDEPALFQVIREGIPATEMPPGWWVLDDHEIWQVVAFVRSLGRVASEALPGNVQSGHTLFRAKGCAGCHQVGLEGGRLGPPLTEIGARRGAPYLRAAVLDPASSMPEEFLQVEIVTRDGSRITGIRLGEDNYSIQVHDLSDRLLSFWKEELVSLEKQPGRSPMPSYRNRLTGGELDDIVAYLASLRGDR